MVSVVPDYTLAAVAPRHCAMAAARKGFRVLREMRWGSMLKVLWTAAWADRKRCGVASVDLAICHEADD